MKKLITPLFLFIYLSAGATNYYVAASGSDGAAGTIGSPYQTVTKVNTLTLSAGDSVLFNRGDTFYGNLIINRSGSAGSPIIYGAYGTGNQPIITGLTTVPSWANLGGNIWESTSAVSSMGYTNMVVINGINVPMGRTPNTGYYTYQSAVGNTSITSSSLSGSTNWTGAEAVIRKYNYVTDRCPIIGQSGGTLNYTTTDGYNGQDGWGFFIQNDPRTLDVQNEWYYNPSTGKIRVFSSSTPTNVQVSTVDTLVTIIGLRAYVTFDGLNFVGSNKDAFTIRSAQNITIQNCNFNYNGIDAVWGGQNGGAASSNFVFQNNTVNNTNNNVITLESEFVGAVISGNTITNTGTNDGMGGDGSGNYGTLYAIQAYAAGILVHDNIVKNTGYNPIAFRGTGVQIYNNIVDTFCDVKQDGGGIYSYMGNNSRTFSGQKIYNNIVTNGIGAPIGTQDVNAPMGTPNLPAAHGIYMDDGVANVEIYGNTSNNNSFSGIYFHNNYNINAHDNTFYNNTIEQMLQASFESTYPNRLITLTNNKFISKTSTQKEASFESYTSDISSFGTFDSNYYCRPILEDNTPIHIAINNYTSASDLSLAMWQGYSGQDANSKKSPQNISNVNQLSDYYNKTAGSVSIPVTSGVDMNNTSYSGSPTFTPFSSLVLIQTAALTPVDLSWTPASLTYGNGLGAGQLNAVATAGGVVVSGTHSYTPGSGAVLNSGTQTLNDVFMPADQSTYVTAIKSVPVIVNTATATLSWLHLTDLIYNGNQRAPQVMTSPGGLNTIQILLNNVASSESEAGNYSAIGALNNSNYTTSNITGTFVINKKMLVINCHDSTFNFDGNNHYVLATNSDGIAMIYSYPDGTPTAPGAYRQIVYMNQNNYQATPDTSIITIVTNSAIIFISDTLKTFTGSAQGVTVTSAYSHSETYNGSATVPTASGTYLVITHITDGVHTGADTANLVIAKRIAKLTWQTPTQIAPGVSVNSVQLNPASDIAGTFTFSPVAGTKFQPGDYTLSALFVPADIGNNTGGTITVRLHVYASPILNFILTNSIYKSLPR